jgi:hypothetical protein
MNATLYVIYPHLLLQFVRIPVYTAGYQSILTQHKMASIHITTDTDWSKHSSVPRGRTAMDKNSEARGTSYVTGGSVARSVNRQLLAAVTCSMEEAVTSPHTSVHA